MTIPTIPKSQHMVLDDKDADSVHFESDVLWDSEHLAKKFEYQSKLLRNIESDGVVSNLKRVLKSLDQRDNTRYCFLLSNDILLSSEGFRVRTEEVNGLQRWTYRPSKSSDMKAACSTIMQDIKDIVAKDPDQIKKRLGANTYVRDYVNKDCIYCSGNCFENDIILTVCPCAWPFCIIGSFLGCYLQNSYGSRFGDPRRFN